mgnify:CR=1 FL=1
MKVRTKVKRTEVKRTGDKNPGIESAKDVAHKINTPLTTIIGYLAMAKKSLNSEEMDKKKTLEYMKKIRSEVTKITKYVKRIQKDLENSRN